MISNDAFSTLVELLRFRAHYQPEQETYTFLLDGETDQVSLTYKELDRLAQIVGGVLQNVAAPGDRALLLYPPGLDYITALFGCLYAGVVAVPDPPLARASSGMDRCVQGRQACGF